MPRSVTPKAGVPILDAYVVADGQAAIWCRYCLQWHVHATKEGPQVAICTGASPYRTCGYYLQLVAIAPEIEAAIANGLPPPPASTRAFSRRPTRIETMTDISWFTDQIGEALTDTWGILVSPARQATEGGDGMCTAEVVFEGPKGRESISVILAFGKVPDRAAEDALRAQAHTRLEALADYLAQRVTVQSFGTMAAFEKYLSQVPEGTEH